LPGLCRAQGRGFAAGPSSSRSDRNQVIENETREQDMKIRSTILTASAILVLAATGAGAASSMIPRDPGSDGGRAVQKSVKPTDRQSPSNTTLLARNKALKAANKALASRNKALVARNDSLASENQALRVENARLWAETRPIDDTHPDQGLDLCQTYMVDCTVQQECEIWGSNCDLVVYPPVDSTQVESSSGGSEGQA
jgi:hypothetical protein